MMFDSLQDRFEAAMTLDAFVATAQSNHDLWSSMVRRATADADLVSRASVSDQPRHLLVLLEDWCGDAVNTIPVLAALVAEVPQLDLRVLPRDGNLDLMNAHLTNGARAIPVVLVLDEDYRELGWWGPRPTELQAWATSAEARAMSAGDRYKEIRRWYARDRGRATQLEIVELLEPVARPVAAAAATTTALAAAE